MATVITETWDITDTSWITRSNEDDAVMARYLYQHMLATMEHANHCARLRHEAGYPDGPCEDCQRAKVSAAGHYATYVERHN